jgi:hypothetical protein
METTVQTRVDNRPRRRKRRSSAYVVLAVQDMVKLGYTCSEAGLALSMDAKPRGSIYRALLRRGRLDLWQALKNPCAEPAPVAPPVRLPARPFDQASQIACAAEILRRLPEDHPDLIIQRRLELDAEMNENPPLLDVDPDLDLGIEPAGRPIRVAGGVVRWVA